MFCPRCRTEYREGFSLCSDCGVKLVDTLPPVPDPEYLDLVTVLETNEAADFAVAESLLQAADIDYVVQNEGTENIWPQLGAMQIQVRAEEAAKAIEILKDVDKAPPMEEEETP